MDYKILIVDDVEMNRRLITDVLKGKLKNASFLQASNGVEVFEVLEKVDVDLIVLDLIMPVKDGFAVLSELKANDLYSHIPVIVSSAITEISSIEMTLEMGAVDYFTKPLSPEDMDIILPLKAKNALVFYEQQKTIEALNREIQVELKNANDFQNIMLPKSHDFESVDLFIKFQPSLGIGGDCFDCFEDGNRMWFIIADVTGHGIAAGMASSMVKIMFRCSVKGENMTPAKVLSDINKSISEIFDFGKNFNYLVFTAFVGCIDNGTFLYANAGQPYPLIYHKEDKCIEVIEEGGLPVGILEDTAYQLHSKTLGEGDSIFLYTDGLFSSGQKTDFVNWKLVHEFAMEHKNEIEAEPEVFLEELLWYFHLIHKSEGSEHGQDFTDDVAMMLLKMKSDPKHETH
jgi:sigma-B regulation protein RsbU (phosphoserine phosphatase)